MHIGLFTDTNRKLIDASKIVNNFRGHFIAVRKQTLHALLTDVQLPKIPERLILGVNSVFTISPIMLLFYGTAYCWSYGETTAWRL